MNTLSGVFALIMGILMMLVWMALIATAQHDFQTAPLEAASLLVAEVLTALALIVGAIGVFTRKRWATVIHIASLGMMLYTAVNSIGVFAQAGLIPESFFFAGLTLATIALILAWVHRAFRSLQDPI